MRLKLFLTPAAFIVAVVVLIWYIWPASQEIIAKRQKLNESNEGLAAVLTKKDNVEILKGILDKEKEKENFILSYLPSSRSDEKIVDGINYIATDSGVNLVNLSVEKSEKNAVLDQASDTSLSASPIIADGSASADPNAVVPRIKPAVRFSLVKTNVSGKYENIKMFLDQAYRMSMFNKITSLEIFKGTEESSAADVLTANVEFEFGYLPLVHEENGESSQVFAKSSFDFSPYSKIVSSITKVIPALDEGQKGKSNPFLP